MAKQSVSLPKRGFERLEDRNLAASITLNISGDLDVLVNIWEGENLASLYSEIITEDEIVLINSTVIGDVENFEAEVELGLVNDVLTGGIEQQTEGLESRIAFNSGQITVTSTTSPDTTQAISINTLDPNGDGELSIEDVEKIIDHIHTGGETWNLHDALSIVNTIRGHND